MSTTWTLGDLLTLLCLFFINIILHTLIFKYQSYDTFQEVRSPKITNGSKDEGRKSSFCLTDGLLSFEESRIGDKSTKNTKVELYSEATLLKMILDLQQYLPNKDHQHLK